MTWKIVNLSNVNTNQKKENCLTILSIFHKMLLCPAVERRTQDSKVSGSNRATVTFLHGTLSSEAVTNQNDSMFYGLLSLSM